jgi:phosphoribosylanthranilate isomerase
VVSVPRVKICGIRSERDLEAVLAAGVDAVGLICGVDAYVTEDELQPAAARRLARLVPPFVAVALVTHYTEPAAMVVPWRLNFSARQPRRRACRWGFPTRRSGS